MTRFVRHAVLMIGVAALISAFAVPAEAGRRHHYRARHIAPVRHTIHRSYPVYHHHRSVHRVYVHRPVIVVPVPHYRHYRGPSDYFSAYVW
jgi:hypothetical protein